MCLVSVVIPTFSRAALLSQAVRSAVGQDHKDIEVIVVDDHGSDACTEAVLAEFGDDDRVKWVKRCDFSDLSGAQAARNLGSSLARGSFILFLDDDDLLFPNCLSQRLSEFDANPHLDFCVGQCQIFQDVPEDADPLWRSWEKEQDDLTLFLSSDVPWQTAGPLWSRDALDRLGVWDVDLMAGHDYEFHIRALAMGLNYVRIDRPDYAWRRPRSDSFSHFEAFKRQHKNGDHIRAFCKSLSHVGAAQQLTPQRCSAARNTALAWALECRIFGGKFSVAAEALRSVRHWGCISVGQFWKLILLHLLWFRLGGRVPVMSVMRFNGLT